MTRQIISTEEYDILMQSMRDNFDIQDEPKVGIFWYDPKRDELFGVYKMGISETDFNHQGRKTISTLHRKIWETEQRKANAAGKADTVWQGDYTDMPRGRVFQYPSGEMAVMVGSWIDEYTNLCRMIMIEFDLPENTVFMVGKHWEIGHGWSE
ncbi:MAG: hypothetical protein FWF08_08930 [Oscillospiraceae bacterium]|nr:hypothetical protein [Oscillospiraceae bacterium]